jgi:hypothetical protein
MNLCACPQVEGGPLMVYDLDDATLLGETNILLC